MQSFFGLLSRNSIQFLYLFDKINKIKYENQTQLILETSNNLLKEEYFINPTTFSNRFIFTIDPTQYQPNETILIEIETSPEATNLIPFGFHILNSERTSFIQLNFTGVAIDSIFSEPIVYSKENINSAFVKIIKNENSQIVVNFVQDLRDPHEISDIEPDNSSSVSEPDNSSSVSESDNSSSGLSSGKIALIVIGIIVGVILIGCLLWCIIHKNSDGYYLDEDNQLKLDE